MTNLQKRGTSGEGDLTPALMRRLWLWGPIAVGGALATLLLGTVAVPTFQAISVCLLYTSPSPRDLSTSRMPSSA